MLITFSTFLTNPNYDEWTIVPHKYKAFLTTYGSMDQVFDFQTFQIELCIILKSSVFYWDLTANFEMDASCTIFQGDWWWTLWGQKCTNFSFAWEKCQHHEGILFCWETWAVSDIKKANNSQQFSSFSRVNWWCDLLFLIHFRPSLLGWKPPIRRPHSIIELKRFFKLEFHMKCMHK